MTNTGDIFSRSLYLEIDIEKKKNYNEKHYKIGLIGIKI